MPARMLLIAVLVASLATACTSVTPWAIKVNDEVVNASLIDDEIKAVTSDTRYAELLNQSLGGISGTDALQPGGDNTVSSKYVSTQVLTGRIVLELVKQDLKKQGIEIADEDRKAAEESMRSRYPDPAIFDNLAGDYKRYLIERTAALNVAANARSTPEKQRAEYDNNKNLYSRICVRHILVEDKERATNLRNQITAGADFAEVAKTQSIDSQGGPASSASNGGDLGCFGPEELRRFIAPFAAAARDLPTNEVSQPVQTRFGFHLIEVTSRTPLAYEEVQQSIEASLSDTDTYLGTLLSKARIKVNPKYGVYTSGNAQTGGGASIAPHEPVQLRTKAGDDAAAEAQNDPLSGMGGEQSPVPVN